MADNKNKIKLLLFGPGYGNNMFIMLKQLNYSNLFEINLITSSYLGSTIESSVSKVYEIGHKNKMIRRIKQLLIMIQIPKHDILVFLGGGNLFEVLPAMILLKRHKTVINIWSEYVPKVLGERSATGIIYRMILNKIDLIWTNWHGTAQLIERYAPFLTSKTVVQGFGLDIEFMSENHIVSQFTKDFLHRISSNKVVFTNMRSISNYNAIDIILQACLVIKNEHPKSYSKMLIIFWHGNMIDNEIMLKIKGHIKKYGMQDTIWCVQHPFLPYSDIRHIVKASDVIMNYVYHDQLSVSMLEAMYLKKTIIASDIEAYRLLNEMYDVDLQLTKLTVNDLVNKMLQCIDSNNKKDVEYIRLLDKRHNVVNNRFHHEIRSLEISSMLEDLVK